MKEDSTPASSSAESAVRIIDPGLIAGWAEQRLVQPSRANLPRVTEVFKDISLHGERIHRLGERLDLPHRLALRG